jgi:hypothetical protein
MNLINVILSSSCIPLLGTFPRHVPYFSTCITLHFSSSDSSSTTANIISSSIVFSTRNSSSFCLNFLFSSFSSGFLELIYEDSSSYVRTLSYVPLTLPPCQLLFYLQGYLTRIFHSSHFHHATVILYFVPQSINVPRNVFFIIIPMYFSYVQLIKLFGILFH